MLTPCKWCGGDAIPGTTCPRSITCPTCGVGPGESCRRPSGHRADTLHATRWKEAEKRDEEEPEGQALLFEEPAMGELFDARTL